MRRFLLVTACAVALTSSSARARDTTEVAPDPPSHDARAGALAGCGATLGVPVLGVCTGVGCAAAGLPFGIVGVGIGVVAGYTIALTSVGCMGPCGTASALGGALIGASIDKEPIEPILIGAAPGVAMSLAGAAGFVAAAELDSKANPGDPLVGALLIGSLVTEFASAPATLAGILIAQSVAEADPPTPPPTVHAPAPPPSTGSPPSTAQPAAPPPPLAPAAKPMRY